MYKSDRLFHGSTYRVPIVNKVGPRRQYPLNRGHIPFPCCRYEISSLQAHEIKYSRKNNTYNHELQEINYIYTYIHTYIHTYIQIRTLLVSKIDPYESSTTDAPHHQMHRHTQICIQIYKQIRANIDTYSNISNLNVIDMKSENINIMHLCIRLNVAKLLYSNIFYN